MKNIITSRPDSIARLVSCVFVYSCLFESAPISNMHNNMLVIHAKAKGFMENDM